MRTIFQFPFPKLKLWARFRRWRTALLIFYCRFLPSHSPTVLVSCSARKSLASQQQKSEEVSWRRLFPHRVRIYDKRVENKRLSFSARKEREDGMRKGMKVLSKVPLGSSGPFEFRLLPIIQKGGERRKRWEISYHFPKYIFILNVLNGCPTWITS